MLPQEIRAKLQELKKILPRGAYVGASIYETNAPDKCAHVCAYPNGISASLSIVGEAATWEEAFNELHAKIIEQAAQRRAERIRKLALAIIDLTDSHNEATDSSLRQCGFSDTELKDLGSEACALADQMAGRGPFAIEFRAGSNGAPAEAAAE